MSARAVALEALARIDEGGYANLVLPPLLARRGLDERDRGFATELVYGTTRMRRACDHLVDRFLLKPVEPEIRRVLRLGVYQLHFLATPPHAAVGETVGLAPGRARGLVNAVLRRVADAPVQWPDDATRLSYPDWVVERLTADLGAEDAVGALTQMDEAAEVTFRPDRYVQDRASQEVVVLVGAGPGDRVADLCAGPGGKATGLAATGAVVVAGDVTRARVGLVAGNAAALAGPRPGPADAHADATDDVTDDVPPADLDPAAPPAGALSVLVADGRRPALRPGAFDRVLVDAPCSGLGVLRRRPDARWRIQADDVGRLADLQHDLVVAAAGLLRPGGTLVYSACTLTRAETVGVDERLAASLPDLEVLPAPDAPWRPWGRGALLLPQAAGTDGMFVLRLRRPDGRGTLGP
jgi:16S rRNA (cytosine967-C5)-methyltransferase